MQRKKRDSICIVAVIMLVHILLDKVFGDCYMTLNSLFFICRNEKESSMISIQGS